MSDLSDAKHKVVFAPKPYDRTQPIVFLSGTVRTPPSTWIDSVTWALSYLPITILNPPLTKPLNWRDQLTSTLSHLPITILNPHRLDWDDSWEPHIGFPPFKEQVEWELDGMEAADVIVMFFDSHTDAPISLLELGLFARNTRKKCVVCAVEGYARRGNVQVVCQRFGLELVGTREELAKAVLKKLEQS